MRRQDDAIEPAQRGLRRQRLGGEHVDRRAADPLFLDRVGERGFIHQFASGRVDQNRRRLHESQPLGVDQVVSLVGERNVERDDIGGAQERFETEQPHVQLGGALGEQIGIVSDDVHAERPGQLGDVATDPTETDNAHRFAAQLGALEPLAIPLPASHRGGRIGNSPHQAEQQSQGVLAGADGIGAGGVHHGDATSRRGVDVDRIDARSCARNHAQMRRAREQARGHAGFATNDEGVGAGDRFVELARLPRHVNDFDPGCTRQQIEAASRHSVRDHDTPGHAIACSIRGSSSSSAATVWSPMCPIRIVVSFRAP
jgi:hypothetical protein